MAADSTVPSPTSQPVRRDADHWRPAAEAPTHSIARWDGASVGDGLTLEAWLGPRNAVGSSYFRLYLHSDELGRMREPVVVGLQSSGPYPGFNWVEVIAFQDRLTSKDGGAATVPAGVERRIFGRLAELVPPGGHLMAEYDSPLRMSTARALVAGAPPRATPLGATLAAVGCGVAFRDWYIAEGGREGSRKLQGFRAASDEHERQRGAERIEELEAFLRDASGVDWDVDWYVQARTRLLAQEAIDDLRERLRQMEARDER